jgi:hypothetical protein
VRLLRGGAGKESIVSTYTKKNALIDLGFIDGCVQEHLHDDSASSKYVRDVLDRMGQGVTNDDIVSPDLIYDLGIIRGAMWLKPLPGAYSLAMDRLMEFLVEGKADWYQLPQPFTGREHEDPVLSEELRDDIQADYVCEGRDYAIELAKLAGFDEEFIIDRIVPPKCRDGAVDRGARRPDSEHSPAESMALPHPEHEPDAAPKSDIAAEPSNDQPTVFIPITPNGKRGRRVWTPERRSAQAERAKNQHRAKPPFDRDLEAVKADWEAGLPFSHIGRKYGCSDGHIRNFLKKHGIDPRRPAVTVPHFGATPREEYEWTEEGRSKLLALRDNGNTWAEIGTILGRTASACRSMFHLLTNQRKAQATKVEPVAPPAITPDDIPELQGMLDRDSGYDEIGEWFGCDAEAARQFCQDHHLIPANWREQIVKPRQESLPEVEVQAPPFEETAMMLPVESPAARWKPSPLGSAEWPDIQGMLAAGRTRESIASDYDVPIKDLNEFVEQRLPSDRTRGEERL